MRLTQMFLYPKYANLEKGGILYFCNIIKMEENLKGSREIRKQAEGREQASKLETILKSQYIFKMI